jgi:hypothetical protein
MEAHHKCMNILLLTQERCGFCEQAKEILDRLAREYWLSITTLPMDSSQGRELAMRGGLLFPPGILIDGEPFSYGRLSERKLRRELDRRLGFVDRPPYVLPVLYRFPTGERALLPERNPRKQASRAIKGT